MQSSQFSRKFSLPKNSGHLWISPFLPKMAKIHKFASISLTVRDRAIFVEIFDPQIVFLRNAICGRNFRKNRSSPPQKWRPFWIFEFLPKMAKHKFASISLTVRDRAISSKFSTHRVSKECNLCQVSKNFPLPKNGGHFEFSNFCQKWQNTNLLLSP